MTQLFIHYGSADNPPMRTESVRHKTTSIPQHSFTSNGPQATSLKALVHGRWRRVYAEWNSQFYINLDGEKCRIQVTK